MVTVDLIRCTVASPDGVELSFTLADDRRLSLLEGLDETSLILRHGTEIDEFQARLRGAQPWLFLAPPVQADEAAATQSSRQALD